MSLKQTKNKIRGISKTHKVTKAMEAVSAVKMRKSQSRAISGRPYAIAALNILKRLGGSLDAIHHPLVVARPVKRITIAVITSDRGLAGSLNSATIKKVYEVIKRYKLERNEVSLVCFGRKSYEHFLKRGFEVIFHEVNISDDVLHTDLVNVSRMLSERYENNETDLCVVVYTNFVSTFEQKASARVVLPLELKEIEGMVGEILPKKGKFSELRRADTSATVYTIEPDAESVLNELMPFLLQISVYHALLESKASEHSARMVAMKNASDKARDLTKELTREYNKARQALITREVSEIVGGIEAMR